MAQKRFDEYFAKVVLEELFFERYGELQIEDKPDLWDIGNNVGIEVTNAMTRNQQETEACWKRALHSKDKLQEEKNKERMAQLGVQFQGGIQSWGSVNTKDLVDNFLIAFCKKVDVLQKEQYKQFAQYDIFIYTEILLEVACLQEILTHLIMANQKKQKFRYAYLFPLENFCEFDLQRKQYRIVPYNANAASKSAAHLMKTSEESAHG